MYIYLLCLMVITFQVVFAISATVTPVTTGVPHERLQLISFLSITVLSLAGGLSVWLSIGSYVAVAVMYYLYWIAHDIPEGGLICKYETEDTLDAVMFSPMDVRQPKDSELLTTAVLWLPYVIFNAIIAIGKRRKNDDS